MFWSRKYLSKHSGVGANTRADIAPNTREKLCYGNFLLCCCAGLCGGNFLRHCVATTMLQLQTYNTVVPTQLLQHSCSNTIVCAYCRNTVIGACCAQAFSSSGGDLRSASSCHVSLAPVHAPLCHNWETVPAPHSLPAQYLCSKHGLLVQIILSDHR